MSNLHRALVIRSMLAKYSAVGAEELAIDTLFNGAVAGLAIVHPASRSDDEDGERWDGLS